MRRVRRGLDIATITLLLFIAALVIGRVIWLTIEVLQGIQRSQGLTDLDLQVEGMRYLPVYGDDIPISVTVKNTGSKPALRVNLTTAFVISDVRDERTVSYDRVEPGSSKEENYRFKAVLGSGPILVFADDARVDVTVVADNVLLRGHSEGRSVRKPSVAIAAAEIPDRDGSRVDSQLPTGTYTFESLVIEHKDEEIDVARVAVGVEVKSRYADYFEMTKSTPFDLANTRIWIVASDVVSRDHPTWQVPLEHTEFQVSTPTISSIIEVRLLLLLDIETGQYLPLGPTRDFKIQILGG